MYNIDAEQNYRSFADFRIFSCVWEGDAALMDIKPFMKKRLIFAYEVSLPLMALFSLATLIALGSSYFHPERQPFVIYAVDHLIWLIFTADLLVRLCSADNLRAFALSRLPELAAVVPVVPFIALNYVFERLGWDTVSSVYVQAIFFVKFIAYLGRAYTTQSRFFRTNLLHYAGGVTIIAIVTAAMFFVNSEKSSYEDAIWWAFVTASTTGYGDIVPKTDMGRVTGVCLMILGVACTTAFTSIIAGRIMARSGEQKRQNPHLAAVQSQLDRFDSLTDDEVDDICAVLKSLRRGGKPDEAAQSGEKPEEAPPETALDRRWRSFRIVRRVREKTAPFLRAEEKLTARIKEESKKKEEGE